MVVFLLTNDYSIFVEIIEIFGIVTREKKVNYAELTGKLSDLKNFLLKEFLFNKIILLKCFFYVFDDYGGKRS